MASSSHLSEQLECLAGMKWPFQEGPCWRLHWPPCCHFTTGCLPSLSPRPICLLLLKPYGHQRSRAAHLSPARRRGRAGAIWAWVCRLPPSTGAVELEAGDNRAARASRSHARAHSQGQQERGRTHPTPTPPSQKTEPPGLGHAEQARGRASPLER